MTTIRSPFFYVGDKYKLITQLKEYFPSKIDKFIDPFCGGGSVFLNVDAKQYCLNDLDEKMIALHNLLYKHKDRQQDFFNTIYEYINAYGLSCSFIENIIPPALKQQYQKTYYAHFNKKSYLDMRKDFNENQDNIVLLYLLLIYGFNRFLRFNSTGNFNLPVGNVDFNKNVNNSLTNYFQWINNKSICFSNLDFESFINQISLTKKDFVYLDPPYLISNSEYNKLWNEDSEKRLLNVLDHLNKKGIRFALSNIIEHKGKENKILIEWMKKYKNISIQSNYISYHDNTVKKSTKEVLIINYGV